MSLWIIPEETMIIIIIKGTCILSGHTLTESTDLSLFTRIIDIYEDLDMDSAK